MQTITLDPKASARFWAKVDKTGTCWNWTAMKERGGYGRFRLAPGSRGMALAHRVAYASAHGFLDDKAEIDHICHNTSCVNPSHLRPVTSKENRENRKGATCLSKSGIRGVRWSEKSHKWRAEVTTHGKKIHVGLFSNAEDARVAVIAKRNEIFTHNSADRNTA